jgi:hypothetical protein
VFADESAAFFAILTSSFHEVWVRKNASTFETRLTYTPSDAFETMPLPANYHGRLADYGETFHGDREIFMSVESVGLTDFYNRFHDPNCIDLRICEFAGA